MHIFYNLYGFFVRKFTIIIQCFLCLPIVLSPHIVSSCHTVLSPHTVSSCQTLISSYTMSSSYITTSYYAVSSLPSDSVKQDIVFVRNYKQLKKTVIKALKKHKKHIAVSYPGIEKRFNDNNYSQLWNDIQLDNGYYTGVVSGYCISFEKGYVDFQFNYMTTGKQEKYIDRKVKAIAKRFRGKTRYEKIKGAHDYLAKHMSYDGRYYNPYYAFKKGRGMCMSYSLAYQRILQEMGIPCVYVKGKNHAWNLVKVGSYWYNVDVTWDDSTSSYRYFMKGYNNFHTNELSSDSYIRKLKIAKY